MLGWRCRSDSYIKTVNSALCQILQLMSGLWCLVGCCFIFLHRATHSGNHASPTTPWPDNPQSTRRLQVSSWHLEKALNICIQTFCRSGESSSIIGGQWSDTEHPKIKASLPRRLCLELSRVLKNLFGFWVTCILEKEMATHSIILAWKIPWTEEPDGLQSMGSQQVGHDWPRRQSHV